MYQIRTDIYELKTRAEIFLSRNFFFCLFMLDLLNEGNLRSCFLSQRKLYRTSWISAC